MKSLVLLGALACAIAVFASPLQQNNNKKVVCYYGSWSVYRPGNGKFEVEDIDPNICTHLIYGFSGLTDNGLLKILDEWNELEENWGRGAMRRFTNLKQRNPAVKTLLAIGGWNEGSEKYSNMVATQAGRQRFIDSVIPFLQRYNFDGFDLDWEYPTQRGGRPEDRANFALLCQEMKAAFEGLGLLLTAAVSAGEWTIEEAYDVVSISRSLDFINVMAYDMHGAWEDFAAHHSPLNAMPTETGNNTKLNANHAIQFWMAKGCPAEKLILGMGTYGRGFLLDNPANHQPYSSASQAIPAGPYTREAGILGYNEILELFATGGWNIVRDPYWAVPYAHKDRSWIGYDDAESIGVKARYARDLGLGGGMFWSVETDDFRGSHSSESYPLVKMLWRTLNGEIVDPPPTTTAVPITTTAGTGPTPSPTPTVSTQRTTTTTPPPSGECTSEGFFPHPTDCQRFYRCVWNGSSWETVQLICGAGTIFDPVNQTCGWPDVVGRPECPP